MARCRFVQPETVRLYLADVHRRALMALKAQPASDPPTPEDMARAEARLAQAEADGDFVDAKKQLTAGEQRGVFTDLIKTMHAGEAADLDPKRVGTTKILAYVLGWSFVDASGKPVPFSEAALNNLEPSSFAEIAQAIDDHEAAVEQARAERKNDQVGAITSSLISPSAN